MRKLGVACGVVLLVVGSVHAAGGSAKAAKTAAVSEQVPPAPGPIQTVQDLIRVRVGSGNVVSFSSRVTRVAVGDPKIVAIHVVEAKQILLQGLAPGRSTVFAWLSDGRRLKYDLMVSPRIEVLESTLRDLDPRIDVEPSGDGSSIVLSGRVNSEKVANEARQLTENMLGSVAGAASRVISLIQFPGSNDGDIRLTSALGDVDPRIRMRRIQVGTKVSNTADAVVLEGRVKDISSLVRAITLAELQLGGVGGKIEPLSNEAADPGRNRNFTGILPKLQGQETAQGGLASYVARGLILKSASGRVLSFLEVDELPQIMVAIRVLQVDRGRARKLGIDYRLDGTRISAGSFQQPGRTAIAAPPSPPSITGLLGGNVVASFVDKTIAIAAAIELLQQKDLARSVAEPNITTLSGESASVLVGGEVPIPTTTVGQTTSVQGFLFQDFGVRLDIRPTLAPNGLVAMEIAPSIIQPSADLSVSGVPGFNVRSVQTTAKVAPGQTLVIGGLISFSEESQKRGVPGLSDIPLLKHLFSWEGRTLQEQEILFVITPRILNEKAEDVADAVPWRDVEPLTAGATVELPPLDADPAKTLTTSGTMTRSGMPPSFHESTPARPTRPASAKSDASPPPIPPVPQLVLEPGAAVDLEKTAPARETTPSSPAVVAPQVVVKTPATSSSISAASPSSSAPASASEPLNLTPKSAAKAPEMPAASLATPTPIAKDHSEMTAGIVSPTPLPVSAASTTAAILKPSQAEVPKTTTTAKVVVAPTPESNKIAVSSPDKSAAPHRVPKTSIAKVSAPSSSAAPTTAAIQKPAQTEAAKATATSVAVVPIPESTKGPAKTAASRPEKSEPVHETDAPPAPSKAVASSPPPAAPAATIVKSAATPPASIVTAKTEPSKTVATTAVPSTQAASKPVNVAAGSADQKNAQARSTVPAAVPVSRPSPAIVSAPVSPTPAKPSVNPPPVQASAQTVNIGGGGSAPAKTPAATAGPVTNASLVSKPQPPVSEIHAATPPPPPAAVRPGGLQSTGTVPPVAVAKAPTRSERANGIIMVADVSSEIHASVTRDYKITVVVSPHPGDAWSRLAHRVTGDGSRWRQLAALNGSTDDTLSTDQVVHVPFTMLRSDLKQQIIETLFPKGSAVEADWNRVHGAQARR